MTNTADAPHPAKTRTVAGWVAGDRVYSPTWDCYGTVHAAYYDSDTVEVRWDGTSFVADDPDVARRYGRAYRVESDAL